jgi:hypothetical protein
VRVLLLLLLLVPAAPAQVHSPKLLRKGQPDPTVLARMARGIYSQAGAKTPRDRAEAIWRYFLTDGRFVAPGFWYHIAGWAYEEPMGEVLDPLKLINSYGFGLCYQVAPLLEAVYRAGGFEDARVWFLTGHTVAEVFYDGAYHHYDSDMMGYTTLGNGPPKSSSVASVRQLESDGRLILSKLKAGGQPDPKLVDDPWYPADVQAGAMKDLAELFSTASDNSLFVFERAPQGYRPDFVLRPNERLIRYFHPEPAGLYYLPYQFDGRSWTEFPKDVPEFGIQVRNGPRSQKDGRSWGTGKFEYRPELTHAAEQVFDVSSPYVIIDAEFQADVELPGAGDSLTFETSTDGGRSWIAAGNLAGPLKGRRSVEAAVCTTSANGRRTAVSGTYGYLLRLRRSEGARAGGVLVKTRVQLNPRILPGLEAGDNEFVYSSSSPKRRKALYTPAKLAREVAERTGNAAWVEDSGQGYWLPDKGRTAEFVFRVAAQDGEPLVGVDAGGRFLDLSRGLAPNKLTAEDRTVARADAAGASADIGWSLSPDGPFRTIWAYDAKLVWKDADQVDRVLRWPEVDRHIDAGGARAVYVRYRSSGLAIDDFRLALETAGPQSGCRMAIVHEWKEDGRTKSAVRQPPAGATEWTYSIRTAPGSRVENHAISLECK